MAMNGDNLGTAIQTAMGSLSEADKRDSTKVWQKIANAVVDHITGNAEVIVTSVSGVTAGGASSGPGTGTVV